MAQPVLSGVSAEPVILILAAGRSERFRAAGAPTDKLSAKLTTPIGTRSVLEHVIAAARASGLAWHVVTPEQTAHQTLQGMGTSIAAGVAATPDASGWLVMPGDLPLIQAESLKAVASAMKHHPVVVPMVDGKAGHPVGFGPSCRDQLLALRGDGGARAIVEQHTPHRLVLRDIGCILDVDTPALLEQAQALAR